MRCATPPTCSACRCSAWPAPCTSRSTGRAALPSSSEFYADLDYDDDGGLIITREHHAVDPRQAAERSLRAVKEGKAKSIAGNDIPVRADAVCVHSDTPNAVDIAKAVRAALAPFMGRAA